MIKLVAIQKLRWQDKGRGGQKIYVFVHAQGIEIVHARVEVGGKNMLTYPLHTHLLTLKTPNHFFYLGPKPIPKLLGRHIPKLITQNLQIFNFKIVQQS